MINILDIFFPRRCVGCTKVGCYFCKICLLKIKYIDKQICPMCGKEAMDGLTHPFCQKRDGLDGMYAFAQYKGLIKDAIHLLKYRFVQDIAQELTLSLFEYYPKSLPLFDYLIPVPLHQNRLLQRGFNQSSLIAHYFGQSLDIAVMEKILYRSVYRKPQVELKGDKRQDNIKGIFACYPNIDIKGKIIALIDDVSTTRSTFIECAKVLKKSGAEIVWGIALAHG